MKFEQAFEQFLQQQVEAESNGRRRERLEKGLGHAEMEFLRTIWYPVVGNFHHLYTEWEVRDFSNGYRYLDHARDIEAWRFKDLCLRHSPLALDG